MTIIFQSSMIFYIESAGDSDKQPIANDSLECTATASIRTQTNISPSLHQTNVLYFIKFLIWIATLKDLFVQIELRPQEISLILCCIEY